VDWTPISTQSCDGTGYSDYNSYPGYVTDPINGTMDVTHLLNDDGSLCFTNLYTGGVSKTGEVTGDSRKSLSIDVRVYHARILEKFWFRYPPVKFHYTEYIPDPEPDTITPPLVQYPRDDRLAGNTGRDYPNSRYRQYGVTITGGW
jgi:hypothetical protein